MGEARGTTDEREPVVPERPSSTHSGGDAPPDAAARSAAAFEPNAPARRVLAGLFWLLASLAILVSGVTLWAHQTLLTSDGWVTVVSGLAADEEVIEAASARLVDRLSDSLGVREKVVEILPAEMDLVAGAITLAGQDLVTRAAADFASSDRFQDAFVNVNRGAHDAAMKALRGGDREVLTSDAGTITLDVTPLLEGALIGLQEAGFIDVDRDIPDLTAYEPPAETVARLETLLGRDIPDDIGTITLVESERLGRVQDAVRAFDIITVALVALAMACVVLALWLSARRIRMVLWLALGAVVALLLGRGFTRLVLEDVSGALREGEGGAAVRAVIDSAVDSLMWFTFALIVVALIVAGLALWAESRATPVPVGATGERRSARAWLRERARLIGLVGVGLVAFVVHWNVGGPDITLAAAAMVGLILIAVGLLARTDEGDGAAEPLSGDARAPGGGA